ncbi:MAG: hypothetical protein U0Y96_03340 [Candidatus Kapaibacterium sp.]
MYSRSSKEPLVFLQRSKKQRTAIYEGLQFSPNIFYVVISPANNWYETPRITHNINPNDFLQRADGNG